MHYTPTSSSWINSVERFFGDLSVECVREDSFVSIEELTELITAYLAAGAERPKPYRWVADGVEILTRFQRAQQTSEGKRNPD